MTETSLREQRSAPKLDAKVAEDIARETGTRVDVVQRIYEEELATLVDRARITQFLGLLADRRGACTPAPGLTPTQPLMAGSAPFAARWSDDARGNSRSAPTRRVD
jgi:hypothetical protein